MTRHRIGIDAANFRDRTLGHWRCTIIARMRRLLWIVLLALAVPCCAQSRCAADALSKAASRALALQKQLASEESGQMETDVPAAIAEKITELKNNLIKASDASLACAKSSSSPADLQKVLAQALHANAPDDDSPAQYKENDGDDKDLGAYGQNLKVNVSRPSEIGGMLEVEYSFSIECGDDNLLLVYEHRDGSWAQTLRWQSRPLKSISDAFGDFLFTKIMPAPSESSTGRPKWRMVATHGTAWCTSRFSNFKMDVIAPDAHSPAPRILWGTERDYSRGDFDLRLKSSGNTFEFRVNSPCLDMKTYERHVIYRYQIDDDEHIRRINPIAINARGFVEEWLYSPWTESRDFASPETAKTLRRVHDDFDPPMKLDDAPFKTHTYGPVRACTAPGVFQVQINTTLNKIVVGMPGGEAHPLPSLFFHVREAKDGYIMLSAPSEADPACTGPDLMPLVGWAEKVEKETTGSSKLKGAEEAAEKGVELSETQEKMGRG